MFNYIISPLDQFEIRSLFIIDTPLYKNTSIYKNRLYYTGNIPFTCSVLHSAFNFNILRFTVGFITKQVRTYLLNLIQFSVVRNFHICHVNYPFIYYSLNSLYSLIIKIYNKFDHILVKYKEKYPVSFIILNILYFEYNNIIHGNLAIYHIQFFILLGLFSLDSDYLCWLLLMLFSKYTRDSISFIILKYNIKEVKFLNTSVSTLLLAFFDAIYIVSLYSCFSILWDTLLLPFCNKAWVIIKNLILKMFRWTTVQSSSNNPELNPSPNTSGNNNPELNPSPRPSSQPVTTNKKK